MMQMVKYNDVLLSKFDDIYNNATIDDSENIPIPDGKYQVIVKRVELKRSKYDNLFLSWGLQILAPGPYVGRMLWKNSIIVTDTNIKWLKQDLGICGLYLSKFSELEEELDKLLDIELDITKVTKEEYENIYFNRKIQTNRQQSQQTSNDMIPF